MLTKCYKSCCVAVLHQSSSIQISSTNCNLNVYSNRARSMVNIMVLLIITISSTCLVAEQMQQSQVETRTTQKSSVIRNSMNNTDKNSCAMDTDCPLWATCDDSKCVCDKELQRYNTIKCDEATLQLSVYQCHCVTVDNETRHLIEGQCTENCDIKYDTNYLPLSLNVSSLNKFMCEDRWNRTGRLCGKCLPGHSPLVYSYDMRCVKCPEGNKNVWKYILAAFGSLTLFYFVVLFFKIKATSSHLHGYLIFSQIISAPYFARNSVMSEKYHPGRKLQVETVGVLYTMWNLDLFKSLYPDICLDVSPLTALALDYAVAIYPLLLTVVSYFLIELHARNVRLVVFLWKPFRCIFLLFRRNWNSRTTVIDAYATFFVLSFIKTLCVSADLLIPVRAYDLNSDNIMWALYYDGSVDYFGSEHLPYAILALVLNTVLIIIPTLLLLFYPFKWFQQILNCLRISCQTLNIVMESFNGCYKNGTESGTRDCRWFAAVPLIGRIILLLIYALALDSTILPLEIAVIICIIIITVIVQPYKTQLANYIKSDTIFWGFLALFYCIDENTSYSSMKPASQLKVTRVLIVIMVIVPIVYMFCICTYWLLSRMRIVKILIDRVKAWRRGYVNLEEDFEARTS